MREVIRKVGPGDTGVKKVDRGGFVIAEYPEPGIEIGVEFVPFRVLDMLRQSEESTIDFDPWENEVDPEQSS